MRKIYFAGSIRGGRGRRAIYHEIILILKSHGTVLTEHVGDDGLTPLGEEVLSDKEIHDRDMEWLTSSDVIVAEVTVPSLGVGYEIAKAIDLGKQVLCLYCADPGSKLSAMISGCPDMEVREYRTIGDVKSILAGYFSR